MFSYVSVILYNFNYTPPNGYPILNPNFVDFRRTRLWTRTRPEFSFGLCEPCILKDDIHAIPKIYSFLTFWGVWKITKMLNSGMPEKWCPLPIPDRGMVNVEFEPHIIKNYRKIQLLGQNITFTSIWRYHNQFYQNGPISAFFGWI